jgi:hypothetical protein
MMVYVILWALGFAIFWAGLKLFDDEVILITSAMVGSALIIGGLAVAPSPLQMAIEIVLIIVLFNVCMRCIERGSGT